MIERIRVDPLTGAHNRSGFTSGSKALDDYFQTQASQDLKRRVSACFVAAGQETGEILGYYTLTATSIPLAGLPEKIIRKLPRYPAVPAALLGRFAISRSHHGQGLGGVLLADALQRVASAGIGVFALLVDAKDDGAQSFYEHFGFERFAGEHRRLFLPLDEALQRLASR